MNDLPPGSLKVPTNTQYRFLYPPKYSEWQCEYVRGVVFRPIEGREPNSFHRYMQRLLLGWKWTKDNH